MHWPEQAAEVRPWEAPYVPGGQLVQAEAPPVLYRPEAHSGALMVAPGQYAPAGQLPLHPLDPRPPEFPYLPAGQSLQLPAPPVLYWP